MKLQPFYRSPFASPGMFEKVSRREAAQLMQQWRRNGRAVERMGRFRPLQPPARGYLFRGRDGESAAMVLREPR